MNLLLMERLGDWNPQLLRELKGQLKTRNLSIAIGLSLLAQFLLVKSIYGPEPFRSLFIGLNWILPTILLVFGVYMLINDIGKEEQRGTLNFIRLSPQSSQSILIGKMLGVPVLVYLGVALAVPLHLRSAIGAGIPFNFVLGSYLFIGAGCCFFYSAALLIAFLGEFNTGDAGLSSLLGFVFALPLTGTLNYAFYLSESKSTDWSYLERHALQWFNLPIFSNIALAEGFVLLNFGLWTYWIWQALNRRFCNPSATIISKKQSYWIVACFEVLLLGFCLQNNDLNPAKSADGSLSALLFFFETANLLWFLGLIAALSPSRQALQDWARYRRERVSKSGGFWKSHLMQDLLWGEKSPSILAVALNLGIKTAIWVPWILSWPQNYENSQALLALLLSINLILILAAIAQNMVFMKTAKRSLWTASTLITLIVLPPIAFGLLSISPDKNPGVWLISAFPLMAVKDASTTSIFLTILGQLSIMTLLGLRLRRQLRQAGESATKALISG